MSVQDDQREWLRRQLDAAGRGSKQELARYLGLARPDAITRMLNTDPQKESRAIKSHEFVKMHEFFRNRGIGDGGFKQLAVERYIEVFRDLPDDLQKIASVQLDALADLAAAKLNTTPDPEDEKE